MSNWYRNLSSLSFTDIRLTGGDSLHEGILNILTDENWGTVCGDNWNKINSDVACRHLGFPNASSVPVEGSKFEVNHGDIWMGDVQCNGGKF